MYNLLNLQFDLLSQSYFDLYVCHFFFLLFLFICELQGISSFKRRNHFSSGKSRHIFLHHIWFYLNKIKSCDGFSLE